MNRTECISIHTGLSSMRAYKDAEKKPVLIEIDTAIAIADNLELAKSVVSVCEDIEKRNFGFMEALSKKKADIAQEKALKNEDGTFKSKIGKSGQEEYVYASSKIEAEVVKKIKEIDETEGAEIKKAWEDYKKFQEEEIKEIKFVKIKKSQLPKQATIEDIMNIMPILDRNL